MDICMMIMEVLGGYGPKGHSLALDSSLNAYSKGHRAYLRLTPGKLGDLAILFRTALASKSRKHRG